MIDNAIFKLTLGLKKKRPELLLHVLSWIVLAFFVNVSIEKKNITASLNILYTILFISHGACADIFLSFFLKTAGTIKDFRQRG